jgi:predicted RNA-binding Zn ribbon-like protein
MRELWCNGIVQLNPYGEDAVLLAVDLATRPPGTPAELENRCRQAGLTVDVPATADDLEQTRALLERWVTVVDAAPGAPRACLLNQLLSESTAHPRMTDHGGQWHMHYRPAELPLAGVLSALLAMGTALHLTGRGMHRLGRCAARDCTRVWADVSRAGRQRYCSPACANRSAVRRHRDRATL